MSILILRNWPNCVWGTIAFFIVTARLSKFSAFIRYFLCSARTSFISIGEEHAKEGIYNENQSSDPAVGATG